MRLQNVGGNYHWQAKLRAKAAEAYEYGNLIAENSSGEAVMVTAAPDLKIRGWCSNEAFVGDPTSETLREVPIKWGLTGLKISQTDPVGVADEGNVVYAENAYTIAKTSAGGTLSPCGIYLYTNRQGVFGEATTEAFVLILPEIAAMVSGAAGAVKFRLLTVGHAALDAFTTNGAAAVLNIGAALPAKSMVLGATLYGTPYGGGGNTVANGDIGSAGDDDAIIAGADLFAAFVDGSPSAAPSGIAPNKYFAASSQLTLTITPDPAENLAAFTAGSVSALVAYMVVP